MNRLSVAPAVRRSCYWLRRLRMGLDLPTVARHSTSSTRGADLRFELQSDRMILQPVPPFIRFTANATGNGDDPDDFALLNVYGVDPKMLLRLTRAVAAFRLNVEGYHGNSGFFNDYRALLRGKRHRIEALQHWMQSAMGDLFPALRILDHDRIATLDFEVPDAIGVVAATLALTTKYHLERHWDCGLAYKWPFVGNKRLRQCIVLEFADDQTYGRFRPEARALALRLGSEDPTETILTRGVHLLTGV